jgi:hypothetical protein
VSAARLRGLAGLALLLLLAGCAPGFRVDTLEPGFDGTRTHRSRGNVLPGRNPAVELNLERVEFLRGEATFFLLVEVTGANPPQVREGETLTLAVDGEALRISGRPGEVRRDNDGIQAVESVRYPVAAALLQRLAGAEQVSLTLRGGAYRLERALAPRNLEHLRTFVEGYVTTSPPPPRRSAPSPRGS